jgi:hypothetical protein
MKCRAIALLMCVLVVAAGQTTSAQPPPRLIVDNRTPYFTDVYAWNGAAWTFVRRLGPSSFQPFPNAAAGSRWRAVIGQAVREHVVYYVYDPGYGGYQDVWWIQ